MKNSPNRFTVFMALAILSDFSHSQVLPSQTRGSLLYETHCITCHTTQIHWRNDRLAYDWDSLKVQVRRWQDNAGLQWSESDITEVSRYLNETIYRHPTPADRVRLVSRCTPTSIQ